MTDALASPTIIGLNVVSDIEFTAVVEDAGIGNISSVTVHVYFTCHYNIFLIVCTSGFNPAT